MKNNPSIYSLALQHVLIPLTNYCTNIFNKEKMFGCDCDAARNEIRKSFCTMPKTERSSGTCTVRSLPHDYSIYCIHRCARYGTGGASFLSEQTRPWIFTGGC